MAKNNTQNSAHYDAIQTTRELGRVTRAHRKQRRLTLETISGLANLSPRFLSEFERGKETAEVGKILKALRTLGLEVVIRPRKNRAADELHLRATDEKPRA